MGVLLEGFHGGFVADEFQGLVVQREVELRG
jgi:hypothetical protein